MIVSSDWIRRFGWPDSFVSTSGEGLFIILGRLFEANYNFLYFIEHCRLVIIFSEVNEMRNTDHVAFPFILSRM